MGAAPSNFTEHLDEVNADQAQEIVRDHYVFDSSTSPNDPASA
jgi:hypothetical protein